MRQVVIGMAALGIVVSSSAQAVHFDECKLLNPVIASAETTPRIEGRSATWETDVGSMRCDVDAQSNVIQFVGETVTVSRERAMQLAEQRVKREKIQSGEFTGLIEDARNWVKNQLKDPYSAVFEDVHVYRDSSALCGLVNAKNSHGAYIGIRPFYFVNSEMSEISDDDRDSIVSETMISDMCKGKGEKVVFAIDRIASVPPGDIAEHIRKLSDLHKEGVLTQDEFETVKKRLISGS